MHSALLVRRGRSGRRSRRPRDAGMRPRHESGRGPAPAVCPRAGLKPSSTVSSAASTHTAKRTERSTSKRRRTTCSGRCRRACALRSIRPVRSAQSQNASSSRRMRSHAARRERCRPIPPSTAHAAASNEGQAGSEVDTPGTMHEPWYELGRSKQTPAPERARSYGNRPAHRVDAAAAPSSSTSPPTANAAVTSRFTSCVPSWDPSVL